MDVRLYLCNALMLKRIQTKLGVCDDNHDLRLPAEFQHSGTFCSRDIKRDMAIFASNFRMVWPKMAGFLHVQQHPESNGTKFYHFSHFALYECISVLIQNLVCLGTMP